MARRPDPASRSFEPRAEWGNPWSKAGTPPFVVMPGALAEPWSLACAPAGGTVPDPFFGASTTGPVVLRLGRWRVDIELHPGYADTVRRRIQQAPSQVALRMPATEGLMRPDEANGREPEVPRGVGSQLSIF